MQNLITAAAALSVMAFASSASASGKQPYEVSSARQTKVAVEKYGERYEVQRIRTRGRDYAKFAAEPMQIDEAAVMLFEIHSESSDGRIQRWRCVAVDNTSECLGKAVKVRYVVGDVKMVLSMTAQPKQSTAGYALLREAERRPDPETIAQVWMAR